MKLATALCDYGREVFIQKHLQRRVYLVAIMSLNALNNLLKFLLLSISGGLFTVKRSEKRIWFIVLLLDQGKS